MNEAEAYMAIQDGRTTRALWGYPSDGDATRARGRVVAYCPQPMVLIEGEDGERVWWRADMCDVEES